MARPPSWLPRLHLIRRAVDNSVRSHYDRRDLEQLFELQARGAGKLLELLPTVQVGTSRLVEREALIAFLEGVREAGHIADYLNQVRSEKVGVSHRKLRSLVRRDIEPANICSLPETIALTRGRLEISFRSVEQLAEAMYFIARIIDQEEFADAYEPKRPASDFGDADEVRTMFADLERMEVAHQASGR